jgi:hypothetical protein
MLEKKQEHSQEAKNVIATNALSSVEEGVYFEATDTFWNKMSDRNKKRLS